MTLESATAEGSTVYVDRARWERGIEGPFYLVYTTPDADARWGYYCGNCDSFDNAMDTMGRLVCNSCGNIRKPDEWDAAHE
ncbi:DUF5816 domain-containing protein [Haloferacaceae archaeon DSL9]